MTNTSCTHICIEILQNNKYDETMILLYDTSIIYMIPVYDTLIVTSLSLSDARHGQKKAWANDKLKCL
jgi:hypothetical protein